MELPGVVVVGKIDLSIINSNRLTNNVSYPIYEEDEIDEEYWEEEKRRFLWLQSMYAKGYTYEELFWTGGDVD